MQNLDLDLCILDCSHPRYVEESLALDRYLEKSVVCDHVPLPLNSKSLSWTSTVYAVRVVARGQHVLVRDIVAAFGTQSSVPPKNTVS